MGEDKEWTFHSPYKNEEVYDPRTRHTLCAFKDHKLTTKDPELAKRLKELKYEEWAVFTEDDMVDLVGGETIRLGDLPKAIRQEFIGKPKKLAQDLLSVFSKSKSEDPPAGDDEEDEEDPNAKHVCPICKRDDFPSKASLNGHFAHCKQSEEKED